MISTGYGGNHPILGSQLSKKSLTLLDKLLTAIKAVFRYIPPLPRMLFRSAILVQNASINHFTAVRAVTDGWVGAAVVQV